MQMTQVVEVRIQDGVKVQWCDVYVGGTVKCGGWDLDASEFANPFEADTQGSGAACIAYWKWIHEAQQIHLLAKVATLKGKVLGCRCKPHNLCHAHILAYLADGLTSSTMEVVLAPQAHCGVVATSPKRWDVSKVRAGLVLVALGDALGVPHEFPRMGKVPYTGDLQYRFKLIRQYQPPVTLAVGQYSDDTEMTLTLARSIVSCQGYNNKHVVEKYIEWAHSGQPMMGSNTRQLLKGVLGTKWDPTGYNKYVKNFVRKFGIAYENPFVATSGVAHAAQSNGSLMRCFPLACLPDDQFEMAVKQDVWSTNPSCVALESQYIYLKCIRMAFRGMTARHIWLTTLQSEVSDTIREVFTDITKGVHRSLADTPTKKVKGWVIGSFYCAMACLGALASDTPPSYPLLMKWVIECHPGSDTDTNAAVASGLIGSIIGWDAVIADPATVLNITTMIASTSGALTDVPRGIQYQLLDVEDLVQQLASLGY